MEGYFQSIRYHGACMVIFRMYCGRYHRCIHRVIPLSRYSYHFPYLYLPVPILLAEQFLLTRALVLIQLVLLVSSLLRRYEYCDQ